MGRVTAVVPAQDSTITHVGGLIPHVKLTILDLSVPAVQLLASSQRKECLQCAHSLLCMEVWWLLLLSEEFLEAFHHLRSTPRSNSSLKLSHHNAKLAFV